jgi:BirA family biotin operon repressor/biotin-[acetyl-CoA-carboxylase] ligase
MIGRKVYFYQVLESTSTFMRNHIEEYSHGDMVVAKIQTKGRGRRNRKWVSSDGNLHMSMVLDLNAHPYTDFEIVMITSLAVQKSLEAYQINTFIKYPNDLIINRKKISGILIEKVAQKAIVGVGINVLLENSSKYNFNWTSIYLETGKKIDYRDVLNKFINAFNDVERVKHDELFQLYKKQSIVLKEPIVLNGEYVMVEDINTLGELVLQNKKTLTLNEVSLSGVYYE